MKEVILIEEAPSIVENNLMIRKSVPANNSCLFTSIGYCLEKRLSAADELRDIACTVIASDPKTYDEVFLGISNKDYIEKLMKKETWGSGPEIALFSEYYSVEIVVIIIQTCEVQYFGIDKNYPERIFLLYDGIHYDPIVKNESKKSEYIGI